MKVTIRNPDGSRTEYYGVQDFHVEELSVVTLYFASGSPYELTLKGDVLAAVDSAAVPDNSVAVASEDGKEIIDRRNQNDE